MIDPREVAAFIKQFLAQRDVQATSRAAHALKQSMREFGGEGEYGGARWAAAEPLKDSTRSFTACARRRRVASQIAG
jgi:hypothetical protein